MNREKKGGMEGSLVELEEEDESCRHAIKNLRFKLLAHKNSNITLFCERNLKHIYCKYLHGEWKSTKRKNANGLLSTLWQR